MGPLTLIVLGLPAGAIAKTLHAGAVPVGLPTTLGVGVAGAGLE